MKRFLVIGMALILGLFCMGCGESEETLSNVSDKFYTLQESFDNGWLKQKDLKSIAYYYNDGDIGEEFEPNPKKPLSKEIEMGIKQTYLNNWLKEKVPEATEENVKILCYYGTYGNCIVAKVSDDLLRYDYVFEEEKIIGGVRFLNYCEAYTKVLTVQ